MSNRTPPNDRRSERAVAPLYREQMSLAILAVENAPARRSDVTPSGGDHARAGGGGVAGGVPGGMSETGTSAIAPAITKATFATTGERVRKLPVDITALKQAL